MTPVVVRIFCSNGPKLAVYEGPLLTPSHMKTFVKLGCLTEPLAQRPHTATGNRLDLCKHRELLSGFEVEVPQVLLILVCTRLLSWSGALVSRCPAEYLHIDYSFGNSHL